MQVDEFNREQRFQILAAYTQKGVELPQVYPGSTDAATFEDFIEQLLHHCSKWPKPKSVLVMDTASIHRSERRVGCGDGGSGGAVAAEWCRECGVVPSVEAGPPRGLAQWY